MTGVKKIIEVPKRRPLAFDLFVNRLNDWWPADYTWSGDTLVDIGIDARVGGLCTEYGPFGFRCDWGRVLQLITAEKLVFLWQIGPARVPEPDPDKASVVSVLFYDMNHGTTGMELLHSGFENHGEGAAAYVRAMDSARGWEYILGLFVRYANAYAPPV